MGKRTDELVPGDIIITEDNESHKVKLTFTCENHTRIVTDTDTVGLCIDNHFEWETQPRDTSFAAHCEGY